MVVHILQDNMKAKLIFKDWEKNGRSVYLSVPELSLGSFHSGTTFDIDINLTEENAEELRQAIKDGYVPVFELSNIILK